MPLSHFVCARLHHGADAQDITDAELDVLQVLWKHGPLPIRRIAEGLYGDASTSQYATVQKLLERLEALTPEIDEAVGVSRAIDVTNSVGAAIGQIRAAEWTMWSPTDHKTKN